MIKVAVVDDQVLFRESLIYLLSQNPDIEVIASGRNGYEAIEICRKHRPDVLLLDIMMQDMDGIKASETLQKEAPHVKIIMLTTFEDQDSITDSLINGVHGFLVKDVNPQILTSAIKAVSQGLYVLHESAQHLLTEDLRIRQEFSKKNTNAIMPSSGKLSSVDVDILRQLSLGKSNREIAEVLNYSEGTIKNRISKMLSEYELKDRSQLVVMALKNKII